MEKSLSIGWLIKRYIKLRGRTVKEVAKQVGKKYTTLSGILKRDAVDAELLMQLANILDLDLAWMAQLYDCRETIGFWEFCHIPRMQSDFRNQEYKGVRDRLDDCIRNNPTSIADARRELIASYPSVFYLLDVLLPEEDVIRIVVERGKERYFCIPAGDPIVSRGRTLKRSYNSTQMLNLIIARRKEEL